ncbi:MAG: dTDP-4-dehydrorhamnose reductase [Chloroflexota bacterium]|nr:dTDP-4-dehydrorhamnose reductase [Chloroflexota bacterium]
MRILITGGRGQLGRELQQVLSSETALPLGHRELDVTDGAAIRQAIGRFGPDVVIHAAACTDTLGCEADPEMALRVNGEGTRQVALACRQADAALLYVSTNEVFAGDKGEPYLESDQPNPINAYGRSKLAGERYVQATLGRFYIVRSAWLYAAGGDNFPAKVLRAADREGSLRLVTDEVASPTWARDLAQAIAQLIAQAAYGVYHLTSAGACSRYQWAERVLALAGRADVPLQPITQAEHGAPYRKPPYSELANQAAAALGIVIRPWQEALQEYFLTAPTLAGR